MNHIYESTLVVGGQEMPSFHRNWWSQAVSRALTKAMLLSAMAATSSQVMAEGPGVPRPRSAAKSGVTPVAARAVPRPRVESTTVEAEAVGADVVPAETAVVRIQSSAKRTSAPTVPRPQVAAEDDQLAMGPRRWRQAQPVCPVPCPPNTQPQFIEPGHPQPVDPGMSVPRPGFEQPQTVPPMEMTPSVPRPQQDSTTPSTATPNAATPNSTTPNATTPDATQAPNPTAQPDQTQLPPQQQPSLQQQLAQNQAQQAPTAQSATDVAPNIIGDFFGGGTGLFFVNQGFGQIDSSFIPGSSTTLNTPDGVFGRVDGAPISTDPNQQLVRLDPSTLTRDLNDPQFYNVATDGSTGDFFLNSSQPQSGSSPEVKASLGRFRLSEATSPLPRDRVFLNYSYFNQANLGQGVDVNRFIPGFEKTFNDGQSSLEFRFPMAQTLDQQFILGEGPSSNHFQFGDIAITYKRLLAKSDTLSVAGGVSVTTPTGENLVVFNRATGLPLLSQSNDSFHIAPYIGGVYTPNTRFFTQTILQIDIDANGNRVSADTSINPDGSAGLSGIGRLNDETRLYASLSSGYWLVRRPAGYGRLTGFAPILELHYLRSLSEGDQVTFAQPGTTFNSYVVGSGFRSIQTTNATLGFVAEFDQTKSFYVGYAVPLEGGEDRQFNGELRAVFNWRFGPGATQLANRGL